MRRFKGHISTQTDKDIRRFWMGRWDIRFNDWRFKAEELLQFVKETEMEDLEVAGVLRLEDFEQKETVKELLSLANQVLDLFWTSFLIY